VRRADVRHGRSCGRGAEGPSKRAPAHDRRIYQAWSGEDEHEVGERTRVLDSGAVDQGVRGDRRGDRGHEEERARVAPRAESPDEYDSDRDEQHSRDLGGACAFSEGRAQQRPARARARGRAVNG
jgi:hypothetical protein